MPVNWSCAGCGLQRLTSPSKAMRDKNCDACRLANMKGEGNPRYYGASLKTCQQCGKGYESYNKARKFCSQVCYGPRRLRGEAAKLAQKDTMKRAGRKDGNHKEIVSYFELGGAQVFDVSHVGSGFPDVLVGWASRWHLVEIKNPNTSYGRHGLNRYQRKFVAEWNGGPVYIVRTKDDVDKFFVGELPLAGGSLPERVTDADLAMRAGEKLFLAASAEAIAAIRTKVNDA